MERSRPYPFLSYAFALGVDKPWMYSGIVENIFPYPDDIDDTASDSVGGGSSRSLLNPYDGFYIGWIASDFLTGEADLSGGDLDLDGLDFDLDLDLDLDLDIDISI